MNKSQKEMLRYKCHKEVRALKIADIVYDHDSARSENRETDGSALISDEGSLGGNLGG